VLGLRGGSGISRGLSSGGLLGVVVQSGGVGLEEIGEGSDGAVAGVGDGVGLVVGGIEDDGGETLDVSGGVVFGGINLGNDDAGVLGEFLSELVPLGGKGLAVTAPRGIELNEDILGGVHDDLVEGLTNHHLDGGIVGLGDFLALDGGVDGLVQKAVSVSVDGLLSGFLVAEDVVLAGVAVSITKPGVEDFKPKCLACSAHLTPSSLTKLNLPLTVAATLWAAAKSFSLVS